MSRIQLPNGGQGVDIHKMQQAQEAHMARVNGIRDMAAIEIYARALDPRLIYTVEELRAIAAQAAHAAMYLPEALGLIKVNANQQDADDRGAQKS